MKKNPIVNSFLQFFKGSPLRVAGRILSAILILTGFICILYYILGPAEGYFHSDCTDTLYWAYTSVESGLPLNPHFGYAAILPFGSQLWLVPLLAIFGMKYSVYTAGMVIFAVVFFASLILLSQRLELKGIWQVMLITGMLLLLSGSDKLREIMWGHAIYYSLGILFFSLGAALILGYLHRKSSWLTMIFLALLTAGVATDNAQMISLYFVPLLGAAVLERFFEPKAGLRDRLTRKTVSLSVILLSATAIGLGLLYVITDYGEIGAGYAEAYSTFSGPNEWLSNAFSFLPNLLSLFGINVEAGASIVRVDTLFSMIKMAGLSILLITPLAMFTVYRKIGSPTVRFVLWAHALTSAIILFLVTIGSLGQANWRLIPMLGTAVPATVLSLKWIFDEAEGTRAETKESFEETDETIRKSKLWFISSVRKRFATVCLSILLLNVAITAYNIYSMPGDYDRDNIPHRLTMFLEKQGLDYGYATFWNSQAITVLSDNEIRVRNIDIDENGIQKRFYQSDMTWYQDQPGIERYFVLLSDSEFASVQNTPGWIQLESTIDEVLETGDGYVVVVMNNNPLAHEAPLT